MRFILLYQIKFLIIYYLQFFVKIFQIMNIKGDCLMLKIVNTEQIIDHNLNFDRYTIEQKSPLATKEILITVNFLNNDELSISGEIIAYGQWSDLTLEQCLSYIHVIICENAMLRDFTRAVHSELLNHLMDDYYLETLRALLSYEIQSGGALIEGYTIDLIIEEFLSSDDVSLFDLKRYLL